MSLQEYAPSGQVKGPIVEGTDGLGDEGLTIDYLVNSPLDIEISAHSNSYENTACWATTLDITTNTTPIANNPVNSEVSGPIAQESIGHIKK